MSCLLGVVTIFAQPVKINEIMTANATTITDEDRDYPDWIELYNAGTATISLEGYGLSDDIDDPFKWVFPDVSLPPGGFLVVFASDKDRTTLPGRLHTNFKLKSSGEELLLTTPSGTSADLFYSVEMETDVSYGRIPDGGERLVLFYEPTPGASNGDTLPSQRAPPPVFSLKSGFYTTGETLMITCPDASATIRYTLDCNTPAETSAVFSEPLTLEDVTIVRAVGFIDGMLPSLPVNASYIVGYESSLPVMSLVTDRAKE